MKNLQVWRPKQCCGEAGGRGFGLRLGPCSLPLGESGTMRLHLQASLSAAGGLLLLPLLTMMALLVMMMMMMHIDTDVEEEYDDTSTSMMTMMMMMISVNSPKAQSFVIRCMLMKLALWFWLKRTLCIMFCGVLQTAPAAPKDGREFRES